MGNNSLFQNIKQSFSESFGSIVFGMEDGTLSIFGLVFGVAASATSSQVVLLAGATGAASAAVSMMAGTYLDVATTREQARSAIEEERLEVKQNPQEEEQEARQRLQEAGYSQADTENILSALQRTPGGLLRYEVATELQIGRAAEESPIVQAVWMLIADLIAASIPVIPFAFMALGPARITSVIVTSILLILLGIGRGIAMKSNIFFAVLETIGVAAAAAGAGFLIGKLVTGGSLLG